MLKPDMEGTNYYLGRRYESNDWSDSILYAEVLDIEENDMTVFMKSEFGEWKETWNFTHFLQGLKTKFYREVC